MAEEVGPPQAPGDEIAVGENGNTSNRGMDEGICTRYPLEGKTANAEEEVRSTHSMGKEFDPV